MNALERLIGIVDACARGNTAAFGSASDLCEALKEIDARLKALEAFVYRPEGHDSK